MKTKKRPLTKNAEPAPLPAIDQQPPPSLEQPAPPRIEIDVNAQGQIHLNGELVTMEELQRRLNAIVENEKLVQTAANKREVIAKQYFE